MNIRSLLLTVLLSVTGLSALAFQTSASSSPWSVKTHADAAYQTSNHSAAMTLTPSGDTVIAHSEFSLDVAISVASNGNCFDGTFACETVETGTGLILFPSVRVLPSGSIAVSYYDSVKNQLRFAVHTGSGTENTCAGGNTNWKCETIIGGSFAESFMALSSAGQPLLSFHNILTRNLGFAEFVGNGSGNCFAGSNWNCEIVEKAPANQTRGRVSSMTLSSSGTPMIAYMTEGPTKDLKLAQYQGNGSGNCFTGSNWNCEIIDTDLKLTTGGSLASITLNAAGKPAIAYLDYKNRWLKFAEFVGVNGTGCFSSQWTCVAVDKTSTDIGRSPVLVLDAGTLFIRYQDITNETIKIAERVSNGGNCSSSQWNCETIMSSSVMYPNASSISAHSQGGVSTAYFDTKNHKLTLLSSNTTSSSTSSSASTVSESNTGRPKPTFPSAPSNIAATWSGQPNSVEASALSAKYENDVVSLSWTHDDTKVEYYDILRNCFPVCNVISGTPYDRVAGTEVEYIDKAPNFGTINRYIVKACDLLQNCKNSEEISVAVGEISAPITGEQAPLPNLYMAHIMIILMILAIFLGISALFALLQTDKQSRKYAHAYDLVWVLAIASLISLIAWFVMTVIR